MKQTKRLPIVGVMGSGTVPHPERAGPVGQWLARQGVHLLTGGGSGVMAQVSRAFFETSPRQGLVIGIIPGSITADGYTTRSGYPNPWVEIPIFTHLPLSGLQGTQPLSRNHINVLSADVIIALPGSAGTASEVSLALAYNKPLVAYLNGPEEIEGIPAEARIEPDFSRVQAFVLETCRAVMGRGTQ